MTNQVQLAAQAAVPTLTQPVLRRGGPALLIVGVGAFLFSLPGLIRGISGMLFAVLNPEATPETLFTESFGIAFVPLISLAIGLAAVAFGSSRVTANEHARREAGVAELLAEQNERWLLKH